MIKSFLFVILLNQQVENDTIPPINSNDILDQIEELNNNENYSTSIELLELVSPYDSNYLDVQTELIKAYSKNDQFSKAESIGSQLMDSRFDLPANLYVVFGNEYLNNNLTNQGIETYNQGLKVFPYNTSLIYNIGYAEYSLGNYDAAISSMIEVLRINPYYSRAHQILGNILSKTDQRTKAVLSFLAYLAINSDQNWALVRLNDLLSNGYREEGTIEVNLDNSAFEYYDQLLRSKAALDDRFKTEVDFEVPVAQQVELLIKKLKYDEDSEDFWMKFYVPFLVSIADEQLTDAFVYFILYSSKNEDVIAWLEKHEKEKEQWIGLVQEHLNQFKLVHQRTILDSTNNFSHWYYNNGALSAIGNEEGENNVGPYEFYHTNGRLRALGFYDKKGNKTGTWKYYFDNGQLSSSENYKNGEVEGLVDAYKKDGKPKNSAKYVDGKMEDFLTWYFPCGSKSEMYPYVGGVGNGEGKVFYKSGVVKSTYFISDGKSDGPYTLFYENGQISNEYLYENDQLKGVYKGYHPDGTVFEIGQFDDEGENDGDWVVYHKNGSVDSRGAFKEGKKIGFWEYFYPNKNNMRTENYNNAGDLDGLTKWFDIDGKIYSERVYKDGTLVGYKFIDKKGNVLVDNIHDNGDMQYLGYYATGDLYSKGTLKNGMLQGAYVTYHYNGNVEFEGAMKDDQWHGELKEYDKSGYLSIESNYENGVLEGYYRGYYPNGQIKQEGWLEGGNIQQRWVVYYINGEVESDGYYTSGDAHEIRFYDPKGRIYSKEYYEEDLLTRIEHYDTLGNMYNEYEPSGIEDTYELKSPSGKPVTSKTLKCGEEINETIYYKHGKTEIQYTYKNGMLDKYYNYSYNGKKLAEGNYLNDEKHGDWNFYYENGQLEYKVKYVADKREGVSLSYYDNGQLETKCNQYQNERIGPCSYYDRQGELQMIKFYKPEYGAYAYTYQMPDGRISDTIKIDKKSEFELKSYFKNGKPAVIQQYKMGFYEGQNTYYNAEGMVTNRSSYLNGLSHGKSEEFYPNGQLKHEENHYYDEKHGQENFYHPNGQLKEQIHWVYGSKEGWNRIFDENGKLVAETFYRNDTEY